MTVNLRSFAHHVGGHNPVLMLDQQTLCKPREPLEEEFYRNPPTQLEKFIPQFKGTIDVEYKMSENGSPTLTASLPPSDGLTNKGTEDNQREKTQCLTDYTVQQINNVRERKRRWMVSSKEEFILLENLLDGYVSPCVLDIKIGTSCMRGTKDGYYRKMNGVPTTASHGLRIHGMHVLRYPECSYVTKRKPWGNSVSKTGETLKLAIGQFLHNGVIYRHDVSSKIRTLLRELQTQLRQQNQYTLFAVSLLVIYEGEISAENQNDILRCDSDTRTDVRLIDFAKAKPHSPEPWHHDGIPFAVDNLINILNSLEEEKRGLMH